MASVETVLKIARGELGAGETPPNSNRTEYGRWYGLDGQPWCMMFVQWCFDQAGMRLPYKTASCSALLNWYKKNRPGSVVRTPRPGDVVIYSFGHTGILELAGKGAVTAIEGNTSPGTSGSQNDGGMVCRRTRKASLVSAYLRPDYEEDEDMNIDKLTDAELLRLAERIQSVLSKQPPSAALAAELAEAQARGITDGARPGALCTRAQAAVMALRAGKP